MRNHAHNARSFASRTDSFASSNDDDNLVGYLDKGREAGYDRFNRRRAFKDRDNRRRFDRINGRDED